MKTQIADGSKKTPVRDPERGFSFSPEVIEQIELSKAHNAFRKLDTFERELLLLYGKEAFKETPRLSSYLKKLHALAVDWHRQRRRRLLRSVEKNALNKLRRKTHERTVCRMAKCSTFLLGCRGECIRYSLFNIPLPIRS